MRFSQPNLYEDSRRDALAVANGIDELCDRLEQEWQEGQRPDVVQFVEEATDLPQDQLLSELVPVDISYRRRAGEHPEPQDYISRLPQHASTLVYLSFAQDLETEVVELKVHDQRPHPFMYFGRYELHERLGKGSFGVVWKAWDNVLGRWVAVKLARVRDSPVVRQMFRHEAQALAKLDNPYVVRVYDFGIHENLAFIVFEFVDGEDLSEYLKRKRLSNDEIVQIMLALATGLEHIHASKVVHRDLKPKNILIRSDGNLRIADFGLARQIGHSSTISQSEQILGTVPFMSPEQLTGQELTPRSDIYALGIICYQMLVNCLPYEGPQEVVIQKIINGDCRPLHAYQRKIPAALEDICLKAMHRDPTQRYASATELRNDLEYYLGGETAILKSLLETPPPVQKKTEKSPEAWLLVGVAVAFISLVIFGGIYLSGDGNAEATVAAAAATALNEEVPVEIQTEPAGAKLAVYPIDPSTGQVNPTEASPILQVTPVQVDLRPGDYLVVAYLADGRFHEVYRRVPDARATIPEAQWAHIRWRKVGDRIVLPKIRIPDASIADNMVLVRGTQNLTLLPQNPAERVRHVQIPDFYIAPYELTQRQAQEFFLNPKDKANEPGFNQPDHPFSNLSFDRALHYAELSGKWLLTDLEWQYAATNGNRTQFPWGDEIPNQADPTTSGLGVVGEPPFDRTRHDSPIHGLCSGVAEWVDSQPVIQFPGQDNRDIPNLLVNHFGVKGGSREVIHGDFRVTAKMRNPRQQVYYPRTEYDIGLGVRFARSAKPRLKPEDFQRYQGK